MKRFNLTNILLIILVSAQAQQSPSSKQNDLLKKLLDTRKLKIFKVPTSPPNITDVYAFNNKKAKLLYETEKGKVYALPLDNMRCLVADINSNMPVYMGFSQGQQKINPAPIPNPFPRIEVIPIPLNKVK